MCQCKTLEIFNHLQTCNMSLNRTDCTTHGLLVNSLGKDWFSNVWALFLAA